MERVAFVIVETDQILRCMLNPESLVVSRLAGIQPRQSVGGMLTGTEMEDDPLLYTNGGRTEFKLHLVFDITLPGSSIETTDVRDLTRPIWDLSENNHQTGIYKNPGLCRLIWGKSVNFTGVVTAVAERLESFTSLGVPRRSWMSMAMQRVKEPQVPAEQSQSGTVNPDAVVAMRKEVAEGDTTIEAGMATGERLDQLAHRYYGDARLWRRLAVYNQIDNPMDDLADFHLDMPSELG